MLERESPPTVHTCDSLDDPVGKPGSDKMQTSTENPLALGFLMISPVDQTALYGPIQINFTFIINYFRH